MIRNRLKNQMIPSNGSLSCYTHRYKSARVVGIMPNKTLLLGQRRGYLSRFDKKWQGPNYRKLEKYEHPQIESKKFIKEIRKPVGLYTQIFETITTEFEEEGSGKESLLYYDQGLSQLLTVKEQSAYFDSILSNLIFPKGVARNFAKAANGASLFPSSIYTHMPVGLGNYCLKKRNLPSNYEKIDEAFRYVTYYRSPLMLEELYRIGFSEADVHRMVAKEHFMHYWSGSPFDSDKKDKDIYNHITRKFYPCESHVSTGSTDLGRDTEIQTARLFCMNVEGIEKPPVTVIAAGDTGFYTDGALHALQHLVEAKERNFTMPIIYLINANNSSISTRFDHCASISEGADLDAGDENIFRLQDRFSHYKSVIDPGFVTWAHDVHGGITAMRKAVDQVTETGRATYVISRFPFRPGGHANDQNPSSETVLLDQFIKTKETLKAQLAAAAFRPDGSGRANSGSELAALLRNAEKSIESNIADAILGNNLLNRDEVRELSQPGITTVLSQEQDPGTIVGPLKIDYLLGKNQTEFSGMGSDIFGRAINKQLDIADSENRAARYVHQENHHKAGGSDSRGGVYGELNAVNYDKHHKKFVNFLPQEAQVMQIGSAFRSVLPPGNRVFVKGPHTIFNEHARDHMKYAAFRFCDSGTYGNVIYMFDGGSIAGRDVAEVPETEGSEKSVTRDMFLARVGEHHNTPEYSSFASDANTVLCLPYDMNALDLCMPEMVRLHDLGRMVICVCPTACFGLLHGKFPELDKISSSDGDSESDNSVIGINDMIRVDLTNEVQKVAPHNGNKLVVIGWGPDSKIVANVLNETNVDCDFFMLSYNRVPNSLVSYMQDLINECRQNGSNNNSGIDVIFVDSNPNAALFGPVMTELRRQLDNPREIFWAECTIQSTFIPYGYGNSLIQAEDVWRVFKSVGVIESEKDSISTSVTSANFKSNTKLESNNIPSKSTTIESKISKVTQSQTTDVSKIVKIPIDGEDVFITLKKNVGDDVKKDDIIGEVESDKATVEITSPVDGKISKFFIENKTEMTVSPETKFCEIKIE